MALHARTITLTLDMSYPFNTINIHTLIRKLLQTKIPDTIIKLIVNYIKGRKVSTTYINLTSSQCQLKTGVPQGGVLSPTLFNIYTANIPQAQVEPINAYLHKVFAWTKKKKNNLTATLAQWGERSLSERTAQVLFPVRPDQTYTVFC